MPCTVPGLPFFFVTRIDEDLATLQAPEELPEITPRRLEEVSLLAIREGKVLPLFSHYIRTRRLTLPQFRLLQQFFLGFPAARTKAIVLEFFLTFCSVRRTFQNDEISCLSSGLAGREWSAFITALVARRQLDSAWVALDTRFRRDTARYAVVKGAIEAGFEELVDNPERLHGSLGTAFMSEEQKLRLLYLAISTSDRMGVLRLREGVREEDRPPLMVWAASLNRVQSLEVLYTPERQAVFDAFSMAIKKRAVESIASLERRGALRLLAYHQLVALEELAHRKRLPELTIRIGDVMARSCYSCRCLVVTMITIAVAFGILVLVTQPSNKDGDT
jgi:hypothetical protein